MKSIIGEIFDNTVNYSHKSAEVKKLLNYYFDKDEIKNKIILDAGCRTGDYSKALIEMGARKVIGIDLSNESIKVAKKRNQANKKMGFHQGDISNLKTFQSNAFDAVCCLGTINYLNPTDAKTALKEFIRVTKPEGVILVLFQKDKGLVIQFVSMIATWLPKKIYLFLIKNFSFLLKPVVEKIIGRKISLNYLKYDILLSLRNLHFGIPIKIDEKFRIKTIKCLQCSEKTTASFKIKVPS